MRMRNEAIFFNFASISARRNADAEPNEPIRKDNAVLTEIGNIFRGAIAASVYAAGRYVLLRL